jgi:predicted phage terminase large subunit-like protein
LTQFEESQYTYLFSRTRRPSVSCLNCGTSVRRYRKPDGRPYWVHRREEDRQKCHKLWPDPKVREQYKPAPDGVTIFDVPLRVRSATNPGGKGHLWVKSRFIDDKTRRPGALFVPARFTDNPSIDQSEYKEALGHLLPVDRERLMNGDWDIENEGNFFSRHEFVPINEPPTVVQQRVRFWDLAATLDGDYTAGALVSIDRNNTWTIEDIVRFKGRPMEVEHRIAQVAASDGIGVPIYMEQEPGSAGVNNISHYQRNVLVGYRFNGVRSTGSKEDRALVVASATQAGNVQIVAGPWNSPFLDEAALFPVGANDDQVDAVSGAFGQIAFGKRTRLIV